MMFKSGGIAAAMAVALLSATSLSALAQEADTQANTQANNTEANDPTTCGTDRTIDIAEMTWPSAAALAHIHAIILEKGFGCSVEIVTGDTVPTSSSMLTRGNPAVAPELWTSTIQEPWAKGLADGKVVELADAISDGTVEGWFIPRYLQEAHPELKTVQDVIARPDLFKDPEDSSKGRLYSCPPGWACEITTNALFEALDMNNKGWNIFSPGSGGALDASIARAFTREEPILFYHWGPTAILGKFDAVEIDLGEAKPDVYACNSSRDCDQPPGVTDYPSSAAVVGAASWIQSEAPNVAGYLSKVGLTNAEISEILSYGDSEQADAAATAVNFLKTKEDRWTSWVAPEVAAKIKASLN